MYCAESRLRARSSPCLRIKPTRNRQNSEVMSDVVIEAGALMEERRMTVRQMTRVVIAAIVGLCDASLGQRNLSIFIEKRYHCANLPLSIFASSGSPAAIRNIPDQHGPRVLRFFEMPDICVPIIGLRPTYRPGARRTAKHWTPLRCRGAGKGRRHVICRGQRVTLFAAHQVSQLNPLLAYELGQPPLPASDRNVPVPNGIQS
jgi:hypothetical protein